MTPVTKVIVMMDTESLGLRPDSILREIAFIAVDADDPDSVLREVNEFLPLLPQEALGRKCYVETVAWLDPERLAELKNNIPGDLDELCALVRSVIRKFNDVTMNRDYEVWFRRPQHDVPMIESLFTMCGEGLPWAYNKVNDLATMMDAVGLDYRTVVPVTGAVKHTAIGDVKFQLRCYNEVRRRLRVVEPHDIGTITGTAFAPTPSAFGVKDPALQLEPSQEVKD